MTVYEQGPAARARGRFGVDQRVSLGRLDDLDVQAEIPQLVGHEGGRATHVVPMRGEGTDARDAQEIAELGDVAVPVRGQVGEGELDRHASSLGRWCGTRGGGDRPLARKKLGLTALAVEPIVLAARPAVAVARAENPLTAPPGVPDHTVSGEVGREP